MISQYGKTRMAWSGATSLDDVDACARVDGPRVWIELSNQGGIVTDQIHYRTLLRDQTADYGG